MTICFVCTGNTCRSPMAQAIAEQLSDARNLNHTIFSRGLAAAAGLPASPHAVTAAQSHQLDLSAHTATQLTVHDIAQADRIYTMSRSAQQLLQQLYPTHADRIAALSDSDIADPFGGDLAVYQLTFDQLQRAIAALPEFSL